MNKADRLKKETELVAMCGEDFVAQCMALGLGPVTIGLVMAQQGAALIARHLSGSDAFGLLRSLTEEVGRQSDAEEFVSKRLAEIVAAGRLH